MLATPTQFQVEQRKLTGILYWLWNCCGKIFVYCIWPVSPKCKLANLWHIQGGKREGQAQISFLDSRSEETGSFTSWGRAVLQNWMQRVPTMVRSKSIDVNLRWLFHLLLWKFKSCFPSFFFFWGFSPLTCLHLPLPLILAEYKLSFNIRTVKK